MSLPMAGGCNKIIFEVPSNPNLSGILCFTKISSYLGTKVLISAWDSQTRWRLSTQMNMHRVFSWKTLKEGWIIQLINKRTEKLCSVKCPNQIPSWLTAQLSWYLTGKCHFQHLFGRELKIKYLCQSMDWVMIIWEAHTSPPGVWTCSHPKNW